MQNVTANNQGGGKPDRNMMADYFRCHGRGIVNGYLAVAFLCALFVCVILLIGWAKSEGDAAVWKARAIDERQSHAALQVEFDEYKGQYKAFLAMQRQRLTLAIEAVDYASAVTIIDHLAGWQRQYGADNPEIGRLVREAVSDLLEHYKDMEQTNDTRRTTDR